MEFVKTEKGIRIEIKPRIIMALIFTIGSFFVAPKIDVPSTFYAVQAAWR